MAAMEYFDGAIKIFHGCISEKNPTRELTIRATVTLKCANYDQSSTLNIFYPSI